jgi:hypothetical protein
MFNERALTVANRNARRQQKGGGMDAIDRAAEREGSAERAAKQYGPEVLGRRISKQTAQLDGRRKTADNRAASNLIKDTQARIEQHVLPQRSLAQV